MNLREWVNYRKNCPVCGSPLTTYLHSQKRQSIKYEDNKMVVIFPLTSLKGKVPNHKVGYSFSLEDNSFCIEFYDKNFFRYELEIPKFLMKKFKELNNNLGDYKFYRQCNSCQRYNYSSNRFQLDLKSSTIIPIKVRAEYFGLIQNYGGAQDNRFRAYRLLNIYESSDAQSYLTYFITNNILDVRDGASSPLLSTHLQLPLIPFISQGGTLKRIQKLILFS